MLRNTNNRYGNMLRNAEIVLARMPGQSPLPINSVTVTNQQRCHYQSPVFPLSINGIPEQGIKLHIPRFTVTYNTCKSRTYCCPRAIASTHSCEAGRLAREKEGIDTAKPSLGSMPDIALRTGNAVLLTLWNAGRLPGRLP